MSDNKKISMPFEKKKKNYCLAHDLKFISQFNDKNRIRTTNLESNINRSEIS